MMSSKIIWASRSLISVVETGSITETARRLGRTQPAITVLAPGRRVRTAGSMRSDDLDRAEVFDGVHAGLDLTAATEAAIARWMGWTLDRQTAREIAMPKGLPYLKGFVLYFSLQAQAA